MIIRRPVIAMAGKAGYTVVQCGNEAEVRQPQCEVVSVGGLFVEAATVLVVPFPVYLAFPLSCS